jgi:hypothetical protein
MSMKIAIRFEDDTKWLFDDVDCTLLQIYYNSKKAWLEPSHGGVIVGVRALPKHDVAVCSHYAGYGTPCPNCRTGEQS